MVKQTLQTNKETNRMLLECLFFNEIHFYKIIWIEIETFQNTCLGGLQCHNVPKFYGCFSEAGKELFVMENLKKQGFEMFPRADVFEDKITKLLMISYGKFHGVSAAFRVHHSEKYKSLTKDLRELNEILINSEVLISYIKHTVTKIMDLIENEDIRNQLEKYARNTGEILIQSSEYNGTNQVVKHGDCWSNNMMFKFDVSIIFVLFLPRVEMNLYSILCICIDNNRFK